MPSTVTAPAATTDTETLAVAEDGKGIRSTFFSLAGECVIVVRSPQRPPIANVLMIHGLGDHPGRHLRTARRLASRGYRTVLLELAGHGGHASDWAQAWPLYENYARAEASADVLRWLAREDAWDTRARQAFAARQYARLERTDITEHLSQIHTVLRRLHEVAEDDRRVPLFLAGHSMGGLLAHETAWRMDVRDRDALAGVVLIAPAFAPQGNPDSPLMQLAVNGIWALRRAPVSPVRSAFKRLLDLNVGVDTSWGDKWLSDLPEELELFGSDPLIPHRLPTRYASSIESLMARSSARGAVVPYDGFVVLPGRDGITSREAAEAFARRANTFGPTRVGVYGFDVVAHDVLRSSAGERAFEAIAGWLDSRARVSGGEEGLAESASRLPLSDAPHRRQRHPLPVRPFQLP